MRLLLTALLEGGLNWDISESNFLLFCCLFSLSLQQWQDVWYTAEGRDVWNYINGKRGQAKAFFGRNEISLSCCIFSQHLSLLESFGWKATSPTAGSPSPLLERMVFSSNGLFSGVCSGSAQCQTGVCLGGGSTTDAFGKRRCEMRMRRGHMMSLSWQTQLIRKAGKMMMLWTAAGW